LNICSRYGHDFDIAFNSAKSFMLQVGLDSLAMLPDLDLGNGVLKWDDRIKYLGVWILAGNSFKVDSSVNRVKFLGSVFGILQKCGRNISDEIKCHVIQHCCLPVLMYGVDCISLSDTQVHDLSVAYNTAVRRCFGLSRFTSVRNVLFYLYCLPIKMLFVQRKMLLLKSCQNSSGVLRLCACLSTLDESYFATCCEYDVYREMSVNALKIAFRKRLHVALCDDGLI